MGRRRTASTYRERPCHASEARYPVMGRMLSGGSGGSPCIAYYRDTPPE
ncbi:MAG: hypothetical protein PHO69_09415 [Petrimonas sp.]|nr:hypothetical protein [Petrimonas sp.]